MNTFLQVITSDIRSCKLWLPTTLRLKTSLILLFVVYATTQIPIRMMTGNTTYAAAAYGKDLLSQVVPEQVEDERPVEPSTARPPSGGNDQPVSISQPGGTSQPGVSHQPRDPSQPSQSSGNCQLGSQVHTGYINRIGHFLKHEIDEAIR
ncbi:hypothetical protein F4813DRAFT_172052 [Daldinia decipiens]|uniref:uncharacterized protein n=1 Tax=Daldinia decipiens TaxID=326647 RepID=UPI0020C37F88|nr:uncharacterized protein F4813DRAFT_172052 [Daldinia decipiens]KAI1661752.1 hypothetical protein F4813DRAFT_172052 [Daldinia decipiens]